MKSTICALVILVILIGGGIIFSNELDDFSSELIALTNEVYMLSVGGDYDTAKKQLDRVDELLEEKKVLIGSMIDHAEFEKIELNFQRLRVYVS
ncbi:MAG: DUF4363 family protein, partial [Clostridia bacterium]|nr:DUF4363 family protein [Clostridia bacterium]